jgi:hypothetical protein
MCGAVPLLDLDIRNADDECLCCGGAFAPL